jgi:two-component system phosphate regulon sensor histidine kinase PhoR
LLRGRFFWRLFPSTILLTLLALAASAVVSGAILRRAYLDSAKRDLESRARMLASLAMGAGDAVLDPCRSLGTETDVRFTLVLPSGEVRCDSSERPETMEYHRDRPEIERALAGETGTAIRFSTTVDETLHYVAVPVRDGGRVVGAARASLAQGVIDRALDALYRRLAYAGLAVFLLSVALSFAVSRRLSRPLEETYLRASDLASGITQDPLPIADATEIGGLADALNRMAIDRDQRLQATLRSKGELEAILATMVDGVLVADARGEIARTNEAARRLLGAADAGVVSHRGLEDLIERILASSTPLETELSLESAKVEARGLPLRDTFGRTTGALVLLTDKTRVRQLEGLRRDFAAHVSHELKTPLTVVQGFADTLLAGALEEPEEARRFVGYIAEQSRRLERLVDELMTLARIERQAEQRDLQRSWHHLLPLLESVVSSLDGLVEKRNAAVSIDCPAELTARVNAPLLERAVANLLDNALRHNPESGRVSIRVRDGGTRIELSVTDEGTGIPPVDRARLFERFYRVAGSRARNPEGLGLGLAIVKHIALAHRGTVSVDSTPGRGTTFKLTLAKY